MRTDYKTVKLGLSAGQSNDKNVRTLFKKINGCFDEDEVEFLRNGTGYDIKLREISIDQLESVVSKLKDGNDDNDALLERIKEAIIGVGSYGLKRGKRLYVGYNKERKVENRRRKERNRGRHFYANEAKFEALDNDLPDAFSNQIVCGDSELILKSLPDSCVDLVFTSPPYNFGLDYDSQDDAHTWESYFNKLFKIFDECIRVLKYGGRLVINVQPLFSDYIPSHHIISKYLMDRKMIWKGEIIWEKNNYNCKYTSWGSWKSPSSPYLKYTWEFIEVFCKGSLKKEGHKKNADISSDDFKKWVIGKWSIAPERNMKEFDHPAMFPEELARRVLLLFSFRGDVILDPFVGAGTTCLAARKHGRFYIGIDNSPQYCEIAERRLNDTLWLKGAL